MFGTYTPIQSSTIETLILSSTFQTPRRGQLISKSTHTTGPIHPARLEIYAIPTVVSFYLKQSASSSMIDRERSQQVVLYPLDKKRMSLAGSLQALPMRSITTSSRCSTQKPS